MLDGEFTRPLLGVNVCCPLREYEAPQEAAHFAFHNDVLAVFDLRLCWGAVAKGAASWACAHANPLAYREAVYGHLVCSLCGDARKRGGPHFFEDAPHFGSTIRFGC